MSTYYSPAIEKTMSTYYSEYVTKSLVNHISDYSEISLHYYESPFAEVSISGYWPGGFLTWAKTSNQESSANICRLHQTIEAKYPMGSTTTKMNADPEFIFENIYGQNVFTPNFKSPSLLMNSLNEPMVCAITDQIISYIFADGKFNDEVEFLRTQYSPKKIVISKTNNGKIYGYCYFSDNNVYAFEIKETQGYSSSSSSSNSSVSFSTVSSSSSSSTEIRVSSLSSQSSLSSRSSASSSSQSVSSSSSSSSTILSSSSSSKSLSSSNSSSASSTSTHSSGSSSSLS